MLLQATSPVRLPGTLSRAVAAARGHRRRLARRRRAAGAVHLGRGHGADAGPTAAYDVTARPRRQDLTPATLRYRETGSLYLTRTWVYDELDNRIGGRVGLFVMDELEGIDVDTELDLEVADRTAGPALREPRMIIERTIRPFVVYGEDPVLTRAGEDHRQQGPHRLLRHRARAPRRRRSATATCGAGSPRRPTSTSPARAPRSPTPGCAAPRPRPRPAEIRRLFVGAIDHVPLLDEHGHLVAVAVNRSDALPGRPARRRPRPRRPCSSPRSASTTTARSTWPRSSSTSPRRAGADCVKFQLRDMAALYRGGSGSAGEDLGPQYTLDLLSRFNLAGRAAVRGVRPLPRRRRRHHVHPVGRRRASTRLVGYGIPALKIASADLTNHALLTPRRGIRHPAGGLDRHVHRDRDPRERRRAAAPSGTAYALLHCQSTYPAPFKDVNLRYLTRLAELGDCPVGYSGHERGFHVPVAAVALGREHHREALHRRPRHGGQRPQGHRCCPTSSPRWSSASARSRRRWAPPRRARCRPAR